MAREAARRTQCSNNLRNLSLAIQNFDSAKSRYPASRLFWNDPTYVAGTYMPTNWNATSAPKATLNWIHEIMPYIERQDMRALIETNLKSGLASVSQSAFGKLNIVLCPSDETDDNLSPTTTSYLGAGGPVAYSQLSYGVNSGVIDNSTITAANGIYGFDWLQNGLFENRLKGSADTALKFKNPSMGDVTNGDGASNTILIAENSDLEEWNYSPLEFHVGVVWDDINYPSTGYPSAATNQYLNKYPSGLNPPNTKPDYLINLYNASNPSAILPYARPLSLHPTGFMLTFCDGRVKFVSESINYQIYTLLMTSNGKKYTPPGTNPGSPTQTTLNTRNSQSQALTDDSY